MVMDRAICTLYNLKQTLHAGAYPVFSEGGGGAGGEIHHLGLGPYICSNLENNGWNCITLE